MTVLYVSDYSKQQRHRGEYNIMAHLEVIYHGILGMGVDTTLYQE